MDNLLKRDRKVADVNWKYIFLASSSLLNLNFANLFFMYFIINRTFLERAIFFVFT